jgi:hypothetical protein
MVGSIVHAGGGLAAVGSQHVQRALDLTWHTLYGDDREPVRCCPASPIRSAQVRDPRGGTTNRSARHVIALLHRVERATGAELGRARA